MADEENLKEKPLPHPDTEPPMTEAEFVGALLALIKRAPPMTEKSFVEGLLAYVKRAEEAGLSPIAIITRTYFRRGVGLLDNLLAGVENSIGSGGKKG